VQQIRNRRVLSVVIDTMKRTPVKLLILTVTLAVTALILGSLGQRPGAIGNDGSVAEVVVRAAGPTLVLHEVVVHASQPAALILQDSATLN